MNAGNRRMTDAEVVSSVSAMIARQNKYASPLSESLAAAYVDRLRPIEERLKEEDESTPTIHDMTYEKMEAMLQRSILLVQTDPLAAMIAFQASMVRDRKEGAAFLASLATLPNHEHRRIAHAIRTGQLRSHQYA